MHILIAIAFLAGIITILSPCILPVLPIVLSGATIDSKRYPLGVILGFILSFTIFTLFLTTLINLTGISANAIRYISIIIVGLFGLILLVPKLQAYFEIFASKLLSKSSGTQENTRKDFISGILVGTSMGLIWTPCVGPILGSVIALALSGSVSGYAFAITFAYALGTAIPMLGIMYGGRALLQRVPWLLNNLGRIQKLFGILLLLVALALIMNWDRQFQAYITEKFPSYGAGLTNIEDSEAVKNALDKTFGSSNELQTTTPSASNAPEAPELTGTGEWFNSDPLTLANLKGKVVLIDFWTYSCINCIRTLPYLKDWHEKYADDGLVIIGVHTPEFEFEKSPANLQKAIKDFGLKYPIVQDNNYKTWRAYENRYWPAKYFIDANGKIRKYHAGEGDYAESEEFIRQLLTESGANLGKENTATSIEESSTNYSKTPETYLGHARLKNFSSPETITPNAPASYTSPANLPKNNFAYSGTWTITPEYALSTKNSSLYLNFTAQDVFLVMSPKQEGESHFVKVYLDDKPVAPENSGRDLTEGTIKVDSDRLYHILKLSSPEQHILKLEYPEGEIEAYAFTFG